MKSKSGNHQDGFQLLFYANPEPMLVYDRDTLQILEVNEAIELKYGYSHDEFIQLSLKDIRPPEDLDLMTSIVKDDYTTIRHVGELRHKLKDGRIIDVDINSHAIDFNGHRASIVVVYDITDRKKAERLLKEREELVSTVGRMAKVGGWQFDIRTGKGTWTEEVAKIHDLDPTAETNVVIGLSYYQGESRQIIENAIRNAVEKGEPYDLELDLVSEKGIRKKVRTIGVPEKENGKVVRLRGSFQDITALRETERALSLYQTLADHARDIVLFVRASDGRIVEANAAAVKAYGYTRDELLSMTIHDLRPLDSRSKVMAQMAAANESGILFETVHKCKDGTTFPVEVASEGIDIDGSRMLVSVIRDVSARKKSEIELKRQEELLRLFVDSSPAAVAMFDRDMKYIVASRRYLNDYRLSEASTVGRSHYDIFPEMPERWKEIHRRCLAGAIEKCEEDPFPRADGTIDWVKWEIRPWYESAGQIGGIILLSELITERKKAAEDLEMSRQRLLGLINTAMDGIVSLDENQNIILFNAAAERMFGVPASEMLGKKLDRLIPERYRMNHPALIAKYAASGKAMESHQMSGLREITGLRSDGKEFPMEASISWIEVGGKKVYTVIHRDISDQVKARDELRESEEKFRTIYENSSLGIYRTTPDGRILLANPALVKMLGYDSFESLAKRNLEVSGFEPSYSRSEFLRRIETEGEIRGLESAWTCTDGKTIYVRETARAHRDGDGRSIYYDGVVEDITDRKRTEEQLLIKNAAIESSISAIGLSDMDGRVFYVNDAFVKLWKFESADEVMGMSIFQFSNSHDRINFALGQMKSGKGYVGESIGTARDGTAFDMQISANIVRSDRGTPICIMASFRDITERKASEERIRKTYEELKRSEEKYRSLFEQSKDAIIITESDGRILDCNQAGMELLGYPSRSEACGRNITDFYSDPDQRKVLMESLRSEKFVKDREFKFKRKNGEQIIVNSTTSVISYGSEKSFSILGILRDITKQKSLQQQLMQAQRMESVGTLAAGVAHDFNNILGIILGHVGMLNEREGQLRARSIEAIEKSTLRGAALVKQLLTFARKTDILFESVRVDLIMNEIERLLRETFPKTITITTSIEPHLPSVVADATQIHQVLLNLCVNARDAMPDGGLLSLSASRIGGKDVRTKFAAAGAVEYVEIVVEDTGSGMDEETLTRIFEPFFTTKAPGKGTGLGLSIVFGVIESHSGFIDVKSQPGKGTSFHLYLPLSAKDLPEAATKKSDLPEPEGGSETIFLIEDEASLREVVKMHLAIRGYSVITAEDGVEAIEEFKMNHDKINIVVTDMGLPQMSGREVVKRLHEIDPDKKIIIVSGFLEPEVKAEAMRNGASEFLNKPYSVKELMAKIRELLKEE